VLAENLRENFEIEIEIPNETQITKTLKWGGA